MPVECIIEALEICLKKNCSTYRGQFWLQKNGTAMGPKNSCSYADIVAENIDKKVLESKALYPELRSWFRFRDDTFALWRGTVERLHAQFFQYIKFIRLLFTIYYGSRREFFEFSGPLYYDRRRSFGNVGL